MRNEIGRRTLHHKDYLGFNKYHYNIKYSSMIYSDFECTIVDGKLVPIYCGIKLKSDYQFIVPERHCGGEGVVVMFSERI